ncbi:hypothetical protein J2X72_001147 [Phyllobacterium sp. 1468]|uniref:DUF1488 domain-containing protein n=1 Tax=Phyllobacterium sp. 1468 TaxID=2817759 RepID=UPI002863A81A|nr:DUF1488 domain-containing protein [Phyllobacterium sp. 1468]MDR6632363.1 hypothetical protein [Phyllobacterium sp. 1468]
MALSFPNRSRSYDTAHQRIRFYGYDGLFEVCFYVEADALKTAASNRDTIEKDCLLAFDAARESILNAARNIYSTRRKSLNLICSADLR